MVVVQTVIPPMEEVAKHSWFSPSSTDANLLCPGRINACKGLPDTPSRDSKLGTDCHTYMQSLYAGADTAAAEATFEVGSYQEQAVKDAAEQTDAYIAGLMAMNGDPELELEVQGVLAEDPTVFGTIDMRLWFPLTSHLVILDYKFGMGRVDAVENGQGLTYAVMSLVKYPAITVDIVIVQPRVKPIDIWTVKASEILQWKEQVLLPGIAATKDPNAPLIPGEKQCKFCRRGKVGCPAAANNILDAYVRMEPLPPAKTQQVSDLQLSMSAQELADLVSLIPFLKTGIENTEAAITARMLAGEEIPGFKLVNKETHRGWADEDKADGYLQRKKLKEADRYTKKLISPSAAEKLIGYKEFTATAKHAFQALIEYPVGAPTYAPLTDKRAVYQPPLPALEQEPESVPDITSLF